MNKIIIGALLCAPGLAFPVTNYYDTQGYLQGFSQTRGAQTQYYDTHGYLTGTRIDTDRETVPEPAPIYRPSLELVPVVPSSPGVGPGIIMIGDPE